jgi:hypothetical protein
MISSKFLKKEDCDPAILVTIRGVKEENVGTDQEPESKWTLLFQEDVKPLVLNSTNLQLIARIMESDNSDDWTDRQIVAYNDPNISFGGRLVGGIRVRAPNKPKKAAPKPVVVDDDENIPF